MSNRRKPFEHLDPEEYRAYQNRLLIRELKVILDENGDLTPEDVPRAYGRCRMLIHQDLEFLAKKWCILWNPGELKVDPYRCCLTQVDVLLALERDALELVDKIQPFVLWRIVYSQPEDKHLQIRDKWRIIFHMKSQVDITSGDISTFPGLFQVLLEEMNGIDEETSGQYFKTYGGGLKLKPLFESLLRDVGPIIVLKIKKYSDYPRLGYDECKFCNSRWVEESNEPDTRNLSKLPCFKTPQELEKFLTLRFYRIFYAELMHHITYS